MDSTDKLKVLLIEDDEDDYLVIKTLLSESAPGRVKLDWKDSYEGGLDALSRQSYDVCLLDYILGDRTGLDLLSEAGENSAAETAVILLTSHDKNGTDLKALTAGAADYLEKGQLNAAMLLRSIQYAVERKKVELELKRYRDRLEDLVQHRTSELMSTNRELRLQIDERVEVEQALRRSEERVNQQNSFLTTVLESLSHPFYVVDTYDYSVVLANNAAAPTALPPDTKCYSLFHRDDKPCEGKEHQCPLREIKRSKKPLITEHIHYDGDGRPRYVEVHGHPILDEKGEVSKIIEYCLDITDRKEIEEKLRRAYDDLEVRVQKRTQELAAANLALRSEIVERSRIEEALRLNEKRLEALLNLSQIPWASESEIAQYVFEQEIKLTRSQAGAIGFVDVEEKALTWCAGVPDFFQCSTVQAEGSGAWSDAIGNRKPVVVNDCTNAGVDQKGLPFPQIPVRRFMSIPVFDGGKITAVAVVANKSADYDQSDLRQLTLLMDGMWKLIQRERSIKALKETENLAAIGRALSSVAHDMRTPLVAIGGFAKQVQRHIAEENADWGKMGIVLSETERLEKMVADMLDFSKPLQLEKSREQIGAMLEESIVVTKPLADEKQVELVVEAIGDAPPVQLDRLRIKRVLINLLTNAIEASPEGKPVKICYRRFGKDLIVDVTDKGPGIPVEIRKEIFVPFFTTRKEGTGLGLPIVKMVVEAHHGSIEVVDTSGGATFRLRLPM